ncbi:MAG: 16S rRNA (cytidine(1402)-2'-O)-methyltransferase [Chloroflexi bacterium]|nr:16S rRNA (cytidine(1402)-2'-O)-methyltransferase [Chloroflexota bacterium]
MPALYLVATPIGNLGDITLRALDVLGKVSLVAAEDTRTTRNLLAAHGLRNRTTSFHQHNWRRKLPSLLEHLKTGDVALVSEAGTPGLSDPGYELVVATLEHGIPVVPVPGPSALLAALIVSGLPLREFHYLGYLPSRPGPRRQTLARVAGEPATLVIFEAPHRLRQTLQDMLLVLGDRRLAVCRELTKLHEEVFRGDVSAALAHFKEPRGECTLVVDGAPAGAHAPAAVNDLETELRRCRELGLTARQATALVSQKLGVPRRQVYRAWLRLR